MRVLIDTNVVLDVLSDREPFARFSSRILEYCEIEKLEGFISALSFPNIVYILRKELDAEKTKEIISKLNMILKVADLKSDDIIKASKLDYPDYEDALQAVCASRIKAEYIITRNTTDFKKSNIPAITPQEFLKIIE